MQEQEKQLAFGLAWAEQATRFLQCRARKMLAAAIVFAVTSILITFPQNALANISITKHDDVYLNATVADFFAGNKDSFSNTVTYECDEGTTWTITLKSELPNLGESDDATYWKPLSDFLWRGGDQGTWTAITTSDVTVLSGTPFGGDLTVDIDYRFLLSWANDKPGKYYCKVIFTITSDS